MVNLIKIFDKPKIVSVCADVNQGKSMLLYNFLKTLSKTSKFKLYTYGLRLSFANSRQIYSVEEMESIRNSLIVVDELSSLFDLDNRKTKKLIENSLRLINHNNNILILCGTPENFKKFISAKIDVFFFKKSTIADFINGSRIKNVLVGYKGNERGSSVLGLEIDKAICYNGEHYCKMEVKYLEQYDSKKENVKILVPKCVRKNVQEKKCAKMCRGKN